MNMIAIDTETYLIKGGAVPPLVCLSYCTHDTESSDYNSGVITGAKVRSFLERVDQRLTNEPETTLVLHNASFDLTVLMRAFPTLTPMIMRWHM